MLLNKHKQQFSLSAIQTSLETLLLIQSLSGYFLGTITKIICPAYTAYLHHRIQSLIRPQVPVSDSRPQSWHHYMKSQPGTLSLHLSGPPLFLNSQSHWTWWLSNTPCFTWPPCLGQGHFFPPLVPVNQGVLPCLHQKGRKSILLWPRKQLTSHSLQSLLFLIQKWHHVYSSCRIFSSHLCLQPYLAPLCALKASIHELFWTSKASAHSKIKENDNSCWVRNQPTKGTIDVLKIKDTKWVAPSSHLPSLYIDVDW